MASVVTPQKPKRAKSAYAFFCDEERPAVMEELRASDGGKLSLAAIGKELSKRWAAADAAARQRCQQRADHERVRHAAALQEYREATDPVKAHAAKCSHLIPKRPLSAYFLFIQDKEQRARAEESLRAEGKEVNAVNMGTKLGQIWHSAEAELKATFTGQAEKSAAEYAERKRKWQATSEFERLEELKRSSKESKRKAQQPSSPDGTDKPLTTPRKVRPRVLSTLDIDAAVLAEARHLDLEAPLLALANRKEVQEEGICARTLAGAQKLLDVLKQTCGSVDLDALLAMY